MPTRNALAAFWIVILLLAARSHAQCEPRWLPGPGINGLDGTVYTVSEWFDGERSLVVVGGRFSIAQSAEVFNIATFDGREWHSLGAGLDGIVLCTIAMPDGSLLAGGYFLFDYRRFPVARWDGDSWQPFGPQLNSAVKTMALSPDGQLFVGGTFSDRGLRVARWTGSDFVPVGTGMSGPVNALRFSAGGELIAAGTFSRADGVLAGGVARWDGAHWQPLGAGVAPVDDWMTGVLDCSIGRDGTIFVAGNFDHAGNIPASGVARWDGASWSAIGDGPGSAASSAALALSDGSLLVASLDPYGTSTYVSRWSSNSWRMLGKKFNGNMRTLHEDATGHVFAAGAFTRAGSVSASSIAALRGSQWDPVCEGVRGTAYAMLPLGEDDVVVAGSFVHSASPGSPNIVRRRAGNWEPVGSGLAAVSPVYALTRDHAGRFIAAGGSPAARRWNGSTWEVLGNTPWNGIAFALATLPSGEVVAGGTFTQVGTNQTYAITMWNGSQWQTMAGGFNRPVQAMCIHQGQLIAVGDFTFARSFSGNPAVAVNHVARWQGNRWEPLGSGIPRIAYAVTSLSNGDLVVGTERAGVWRWNGQAWSVLAEPLGDSSWWISSIVELPGGHLLCVGDFEQVNVVAAFNAAEYDGIAWRGVGTSTFRQSTLDQTVWCAARSSANEAIIGTHILKSDARVVALAASLSLCPCDANCDGSTAAPVLNAMDFQCFLSKFSAAAVLTPAQQLTIYANCDHSTGAPVLNVNDFTCFINKYAAGCP